jgi:DNA-binding CsgD family transcriptional regulator
MDADAEETPSPIRRVYGMKTVQQTATDREAHEEHGLTTREREVLRWVAHGKTNVEIAELLWIAPTTVRRHLEHVYAKLDVHTRTAAVARLLGILDNDAWI